MKLTYSEMSQFQNFKDRYNYLRQNGKVGEQTFGYERYLNQEFYRSKEWKDIRNYIIVRDGGCDLGISDYPIQGNIYIHHINPLTEYDIINNSQMLIDPENLICVSFDTHNAIHYGNEDILNKYEVTQRYANDTCPWKK